jgi:hypothetical protein
MPNQIEFKRALRISGARGGMTEQLRTQVALETVLSRFAPELFGGPPSSRDTTSARQREAFLANLAK